MREYDWALQAERSMHELRLELANLRGMEIRLGRAFAKATMVQIIALIVAVVVILLLR